MDVLRPPFIMTLAKTLGLTSRILNAISLELWNCV